MRVIVSGLENNKQVTYTYDLLDRYDAATKTSSMARTTGYTCTGAARLILENKFTRKGVSTPEFVGEDENCFNTMINYLKERNINYRMQKRCINVTFTYPKRSLRVTSWGQDHPWLLKINLLFRFVNFLLKFLKFFCCNFLMFLGKLNNQLVNTGTIKIATVINEKYKSVRSLSKNGIKEYLSQIHDIKR